MKKFNLKSIVALMATAIAVLMTSCSKDDSMFGLGLEGEYSAVYSLYDSYHVTLEGVTVVNDSLRITCGHEAIFTAKDAEDLKKQYKV